VAFSGETRRLAPSRVHVQESEIADEGQLAAIQHVVVLMFENQFFDHGRLHVCGALGPAWAATLLVVVLDEHATVTAYVRRPGPPPPPGRLTRAQFVATYGADRPDLDAVASYAAACVSAPMRSTAR
jgi:hypothetical protein